VVQLSVVCKWCGKEFPTELDYGRVEFQDAEVAPVERECPHCHSHAVYEKPDYRFPRGI
jgi:DNA-directed RNA polymerase subunit RPC12/RpoP